MLQASRWMITGRSVDATWSSEGLEAAWYSAVNAGDDGCDVVVHCDDMDTCGEVIQDMTKALGLGGVECTGFPCDMVD